MPMSACDPKRTLNQSPFGGEFKGTIDRMVRRRRHAQFVAEACNCTRQPIQLKRATIFEVHQHGRSRVGWYAAVEVAMLRHIFVAEINSFGLGNRDSFRNGISQELTGLRVAHYWSGCLVQHGAYATECGKQR